MRKMVNLSILICLLMVLSGVIHVFAAETVTVTGEPIDTYCYVLMGAKGGSHRECAIVRQERDSGRTAGRWHKQDLHPVA
jgi:hypothetical protein